MQTCILSMQMACKCCNSWAFLTKEVHGKPAATHQARSDAAELLISLAKCIQERSLNKERESVSLHLK